MDIQISDLRNTLLTALRFRGLTPKEANIVAEPFLEAELSGKKTHGITKFFLIDEAIKNRRGQPRIVKNNFNYALIDAQQELGYISAQFATAVLIKKARLYGNALVATRNSYYYSMAGLYARKVAEAGFISIITNNGGPAAVTPFGGVDPVLGTNPLAIGIPFSKGPIVLDLATSEQTWGEINQAKLEKRKLKPNTFYDARGNFTTNPQLAVAIKAFGQAKGAGLNFMLEILTGALVGTKMGLQSKSGYDLGFLFFAFSPKLFSTPANFDQQVKQLVREMKHTRTVRGVKQIFLPGEKSWQTRQKHLKRGNVQIPQVTWNKLQAFARGEDIKAQQRLVE